MKIPQYSIQHNNEIYPFSLRKKTITSITPNVHKSNQLFSFASLLIHPYKQISKISSKKSFSSHRCQLRHPAPPAKRELARKKSNCTISSNIAPPFKIEIFSPYFLANNRVLVVHIKTKKNTTLPRNVTKKNCHTLREISRIQRTLRAKVSFLCEITRVILGYQIPRIIIYFVQKFEVSAYV